MQEVHTLIRSVATNMSKKSAFHVRHIADEARDPMALLHLRHFSEETQFFLLIRVYSSENLEKKDFLIRLKGVQY